MDTNTDTDTDADAGSDTIIIATTTTTTNTPIRHTTILQHHYYQAMLLALCTRTFHTRCIIFTREKRRAHRLRILFGQLLVQFFG